MNYLKVWTSFREVMHPLTLEEKGSLFDKMLTYAETGEVPKAFVGNETFIWPVAKRDIDMAERFAETCRNNGLKGGRPRNKKPEETEINPAEPNETEINPEKPNHNQKEIKRKEKKGNEIKFIDDDGGIHKTLEDQNKLLDAAEYAGFDRTDAVRAKLVDLMAEYGLQKVLDGIGTCVDYGAKNIAYLTAVLKGTKRKNSAGNYHQRSYSGTQDEYLRKMMEGA